MCAFRSRVERKKERRKKMLFWGFIAADILYGLWMSIFSFNASTKIIEGKITPKEELLRKEGVVTDWEYMNRPGTRYSTGRFYFKIELDGQNAYKVMGYVLDAFERKKFMESGMGSYVTLLLDEKKGYGYGDNYEAQVAEIRSGDICYLSYEDYVDQQYQSKEFQRKTRWMFAILSPIILAWWPIYYILWERWKKRKRERNLPYRIRK